MKYFLIDRLTRNLKTCTIGRLFAVDDTANDSVVMPVRDIGYTCELPYRSNEAYISCVPPGQYDLMRYRSQSKGEVVVLQNHELGVTFSGPSQRTYIYMHVLNFPEQSEGCIGPGLDLHPERWGVIDSETAMNTILRLFDQGYKKLVIR